MAVIKCKECGEKVSTKAKACPSCGALTQKKTSLTTWFVLIAIILIIYSISKSPSSTKKITTSSIETTGENKTTTDTSNIIKPAKVEPVKPSWHTFTSKDEMTGKFSAYATSPRVYPSPQMSFPYQKVSSKMTIGCNSTSEWAYFSFESSPNLTKDETKDGYNLISTRIKWDDSVENVQLTQDWGARFIHFLNGQNAITKIENSNTAKLELNWHGERPTYFEYTLNGSSTSLKEIRSLCAKN